jgi:hypothetical protein
MCHLNRPAYPRFHPSIFSWHHFVIGLPGDWSKRTLQWDLIKL